ncbi:HDIG domain-containing metalloprotein [Thiomonas sp. FB-Cd]|uniref:HDIG domain-containing metalloprotein n=1 Tax=Thiomonas sp. FB-Cd TaxID=1158292 RepID=UPI0004DEF3DF|nr:HD domain-containing protein [Thiomonas sp. FB-Cd]
MHGHHNDTSGNLRNTVEVAEQVRALCAERLYVHRDLAVLSALLHDCGKAVEYRLKPDGSWGHYHRHLGRQPFRAAVTQAAAEMA